MDKDRFMEICKETLETSYEMALRQTMEATSVFIKLCKKPISKNDFRIALQALIHATCLLDGMLSLMTELDEGSFDPSTIAPTIKMTDDEGS